MAATATLGGTGWLAWQSGRGLTMSRLDGSERRLLLKDGSTRQAGHPDWSPDGARVAYRVDAPDGTTDIWTVNRDGSDDRRLIDCLAPCTYAEEPAWSPDGKRLAYWTNGDNQPQVIRVADTATGKTLVTVPAPDLVGPITPRWSPDGRYLAVHAEIVEQNGADYRTVDGRIALIDLEADSPTIDFITPGGMLAMYPDWSPDGTRILFLAGNLDPFFGTNDPTDLYTVRPDGSDLVRLTRRTRGEPVLGGPTWTRADPPILLTVIRPGGRYSLGAIGADGAGLVDLVGTDGTALDGAHPRAWVQP
jgi:TolB protein